MASLCRLRAISGVQSFSRIHHFRKITSLSASCLVFQRQFEIPPIKRIDVQRRVIQLSTPACHYGSVPEMTIDSIKERCTLVLKLFDKIDPEKVNLEAKFIEDLGLDSLDAVEIIMAMEDEFGVEIPDETAEKLLNLRDVVECLADRLDVAR